MKKFFIAFFAMGLSLMTSSPAMAGNFSETCRNISVDGGQLTAICRTVDQRERHTGINLDRFVGNANGRLVWEGHNFSHSAHSIHMRGSNLSAICRTRDGRERKCSINLDTEISNINGKLRRD
jgi:CVNH domain.